MIDVFRELAALLFFGAAAYELIANRDNSAAREYSALALLVYILFVVQP